ncbi:MAG: hypothetical protein LUC38_01170 [Oscillospiraceae bacterium]|nr:hypothetical protein [Oscillospiraceae bacterium]
MENRVSLKKYFRKIRSWRSEFRRRYKTLCLDGCTTDDEILFADNYRILSDSISYLLSCDPKARLTPDFPVTGYLISHFSGKIPPTDEIIFLIGDYAAGNSINPCDIENLKFELTYLLLENLSQNFHESISMLSGLSSLDECRINETVNPVAIELANDEFYPQM